MLKGESPGLNRRGFLWMAGCAVGMSAFGDGRPVRAAVREAVDKYVADGLYAGLACVSNRNDLYVRGSRRLDDPTFPITADSLFDLASVGKTQTAALCALLYADGKRPVWPRGDRFFYTCSNFSTAPDMLRFVTDMLRRERFPKAYYDLQFTPSFDKGGYRRSFGWEMTAPKSACVIWTKTSFSPHAICHSGYTGPAIAVDPERDFAGVVLGNRKASKEKAMGPRMHILDLMAILG